LTGAAKDAEPLNKTQKKKLAKKLKLESGEAAEGVTKTVEATKEKAKEVVDKVTPKKEEKKSAKQTLPSGLIIEDTKVGDGPAAKQGKRLGMRYIGKLTSGKQFDANTSGAPFKFVLGRGEVIKGELGGCLRLLARGVVETDLRTHHLRLGPGYRWHEGRW
jgi:FK506-binding nuclear protein